MVLGNKLGISDSVELARAEELELTDSLFVMKATLMGRHSGTTKSGCVVDDDWHANYGLLNTISARSPVIS